MPISFWLSERRTSISGETLSISKIPPIDFFFAGLIKNSRTFPCRNYAAHTGIFPGSSDLLSSEMPFRSELKSLLSMLMQIYKIKKPVPIFTKRLIRAYLTKIPSLLPAKLLPQYTARFHGNANKSIAPAWGSVLYLNY